MRTLDIAMKDLVQILRDRQSLLFLVAMPIIFTLFMGMAFQTPQDDAGTRLVLALVDHEAAAEPSAPPMLGKQIAAQIERSGLVQLVPMAEAEALEAVQEQEAAAALIIPPGFSAAAVSGSAAGSAAGSPAQLTLVADPASTAGQSIYQIVRAPVMQVMSTVEIARLDVETAAAQASMSDGERQAEFQTAFQLALSKWESAGSPAFISTQLAAAPAASDPYGGNPYNQASPGILVMFAVFGLVSSAQILVHERKTHTLERMLTTSLSRAEAVGGHFLAIVIQVTLQQMLLVTFGQLVLGVDYLRAPVGVLVIMVAFSVCIASLGLVLGVFARSDEQVALFSLVAMFILSALGGAWFPLEGAGQVFSAIGRFTPTAWSMTGYQNLLVRGLGSASVLLPAGVLLLYAAGFFTLAAWRIRKA